MRLHSHCVSTLLSICDEIGVKTKNHFGVRRVTFDYCLCSYFRWKNSHHHSDGHRIHIKICESVKIYTFAKSYKPHNTLCERRLLHIDPFDKWIKLKRRGHLGVRRTHQHRWGAPARNSVQHSNEFDFTHLFYFFLPHSYRFDAAKKKRYGLSYRTSAW